MSYCRWSSDHFKCDVYVYADCSGGFTCHVASNRITSWAFHPGEHPKIRLHGRAKKIKARLWARYRKWAEAESEWLETTPRMNIPHLKAGSTFNTDTAAGMADALQKLKDEGLNVPDGVIEALRGEGDENSDD